MFDLDTYPHLLKDFSRYKSVVQGRSPKTVEEYLIDLRTFTRYLWARKKSLPTDRASLEAMDITNVPDDFYFKVTTDDIYDFLFFTEKILKNGATARSRKLSAIRAFYKYLTQKTHQMDKNPAVDIDSPRLKKMLPKHLTVNESITLLETVKNNAENKYRVRDFTIITLFLNCGMRLSELCSINFSDLDPELRSMRVVGKGSKERIIYLNDACRAALKDYIPVRLAEHTDGERESALFISSRGQRISNKTVQYLVKKHLGEAGLEYKHLSTHKLRHTAATLMYQSGQVDIRVLKDILGHEQLNTTQIYTHISSESMEEAMAKNPLANLGGVGELNIPKSEDKKDESQ